MNAKRLEEIQERKNQMVKEIEEADEKRMAELEQETADLEKEEAQLRAEADVEKRKKGLINMGNNEVEQRAKIFMETGKTKVNTRSLLSSTTGIAKPTEVNSQIHDIVGAKYSSIVDLVKMVDCTGMGTNRVPYVVSEADAGDSTEETASTGVDSTFNFVDLSPSDIDIINYVSVAIRKKTPVEYEAKVREIASNALKRKLSKKIIDGIYGSSLCATKEYAKNATAGQSITASTLRDIVMSYGGDEGLGGGILILNKKDLIAFGDVRGTNEKKAIYEITPDAGNENTGTIKDGGLVVRYIINKNCNAFAGEKGASKKTMIYGNLHNCELDVWGDIEITASSEYKFAEKLLTIMGSASVATDVVAKNGFVLVTIGA